jgi:hypothetical protein
VPRKGLVWGVFECAVLCCQAGAGAAGKKDVFFAIDAILFLYKTPNICQDRLGTDIGADELRQKAFSRR